jgi:gliding motility-associated-like protein
MKLHVRLPILLTILLFPLFSFGQNVNVSNTGCPGIPGACGYHPSSSVARSGPVNTPQNGNGTLGVIYDQAKCGLDYTAASQRIGTRFSPAGVPQPAPFAISGIPACAVIEKAYLWAEGSGNGAAQTATVNGPLGSANYPMTIVGSGPDKCWGYSGSYTYRADVTPSVNGNGTYNISGLLTAASTSGNDMDGATLMVIWSLPSANWQGRVVIADGAMVVNGGVANYNLPISPAVCGATTNARAFCGLGDIQMAVNSLTLNGTADPIAWNWWNFEQVNTTVAAAATTANFNCNTSGDCFNLCIAGVYFRTTTCATCPTTTAFTVNTSSTPASCSACNGTATATVSPAGAYTYSWSPAPGAGGNTATPSSMCAGNYTVTVSTSCATVTATVNVATSGGGVTSTAAQTNVTCNGSCNGSASVTVTSGNAPYTYVWSPAPGGGQGTSVATGLCAGTYTCTITDNTGCTGTQVFTITQPPAITFTQSQVNVTCNGSCNGTASVVAAGGTGTYTYNWSPAPGGGQGTANATGLCAGTYSCTITSGPATCSTVAVFTITQPPAITATQSQVNVNCNGSCNGSATVVAAGGTGTYTYNWAPAPGGGQGTATATGLCAGTYTCTISSPAGCSINSSFTITQPPAITTTQSQVNVNCNGACNGSASVVASGGSGSFTYNWSPAPGAGQGTANASSLCAGTYTCTIADASVPTCTTTATFSITQPPAITTTQSQTNVNCNGACNGTASVVASGGSGTFTYNWSPTPGAGQGTANASSLCAGTYTCTIADATTPTCTTTATFSITQPTALTATTSFVTATCGNSNGSATVTPSGGAGGYTYNWAPVAGSSATLPNIPAGAYTCTIGDANNCTITVTVNVPNAGSPTVTLVSSTNVTCFNACDGTADMTVSGGSGGYTYNWNPAPGGGQGTASASGLCPGTYTLTGTDSNGCSATETVTITQPTQLTATGTSSNVTCFSACDGTASVTANGGTGTYSYNWSPSPGSGQGTANASAMCAGTYTCTITDSNNCTATVTFTITEPTQLTVVAAGFNVTCYGVCDGQIVSIPAGGTPNYSFSWSTGCTSASCNNICAGNYTVTVTDMNGCTATATASVTEPLPITLSASTIDAHCNQADGSAAVTYSGGTGTLTPVWYNPATPGDSITNIPAGNYYVVVTDANGCDDTANVTVNNLPGVIASAGTLTDVSCFGGNDGSFTVNDNGVNSPYTYSWTCSASNTNTASNLSAGTCSVTLTDNSGCTSTVSFTITQPTQLTVTPSATPGAVCEGASVQLSATGNGGTPAYQYAWSPGPLIGQTQTVTPAASGTYTVYISDSHNCIDSATVNVTVNPIPVVSFSGDSLAGCAPLCVNFTDLSTVSSGTISQWSWNFGDGNTSTSQSPSNCYLLPGLYSVSLTVTSAAGCSNSINFPNYINVFANPVAEFTASPQPTTELNPTIYFTNASTGATSWTWSFGDVLGSSSSDQNPSFMYPGAGCYDVLLTVSTANGCIDTTVHQVCIDPDVSLYVPNAFTPNGDGRNETFFPQGIGIDPDKYELWVFDRWGNLIFYTDDMTKAWDGTVQGKGGDICQEDVYVWTIKCIDLLGKKHNLIGHVSLIR